MNPSEFALCADALRRAAVFKGVPAPEIEAIARQGMLLDARKDDLILYENMRGRGLYVVAKGVIEVLKIEDAALPGARAVPLATLAAGDCLGEYSVIDGLETSASARAAEDAKLFFLPRGAFLRLIDEGTTGKTISKNLLLHFVGRLRQGKRPSSPGAAA